MEHSEFKRVWLLKREITQTRGRPARFDGLARVNRRWTYLEWGNLEVDGADYTAGRRYQWAPVEGGFDISFEDGAPFHEMRFARPVAQHFCAPDDYQVVYDFSDWPKWRSTWTVSGPRKDYVMSSLYAPFNAQNSLQM
ncbi:MAG: DUF6314 family protein [Pseudomonadota bacterium]